jgi:predicted nucleic acid-binding protein
MSEFGRVKREAAKSDPLATRILARRGGELLDADALWDAVRADKEERDASFIVRTILPGPRSDSFRSQMELWLEDGCMLHAPTMWVYETTTALCKAVFFGLLTDGDTEESLSLLQDLAIELVPPDAEQACLAFGWTRRLNRVAAYNSFYLAVAESLGCELWTADQRLSNAVDLPWVRRV